MIIGSSISVIYLCDYCLSSNKHIYNQYRLEISSKYMIQICEDCIDGAIPKEEAYISSLHIIKWYILLYEYQKKGYKLVSRRL